MHATRHARWSRRLGHSLGLLAQADVTLPIPLTAAAQFDRTIRATNRARQRAPRLAGRLDEVTARIRTIHDGLVERPAVPVHGSPHVHQWLIDGERHGLVDFDRCGMGDPELDIATYLGELDTESKLMRPVAEHDRAMVEGFEPTGLRLDPQRLWIYRVHKRIAKVARTTQALRPDADRRAARHLDSVEQLLDTPPDSA